MRNAILALMVERERIKKTPVNSIQSARLILEDLIELESREWRAYIIDDSGYVGEFMPNLNFELFKPTGNFSGNN